MEPKRATQTSGHIHRGWKIARPQLPEHVLPRERLIAQLERPFADENSSVDTIVVGAPAGYGKTTLLAQWAAKTRLSAMWYHLDAGDSDPASLIYGLIRSLRVWFPRGQWEVRTLLSHAHKGALSPTDLLRAANVFAADIAEHVTKPSVLIVTGVDHLEPTGGARALLEHLLARTRDELKVVLEYRDVSPLNLARPVAQRRVKGVALEDLRFTREELTELLASYGIAANAAFVERLDTLCEGWVAGELLATGILWPANLAARTTDELNREMLFEYVAQEVLAQLPKEIYDFAVDAAVLSYMTVPLCRDLLDVHDARKRLAALVRATGMVTQIGIRPQEPVYRFQPLLREMLLERLASRRGTDALARLRVRAGRLLEQAEDDEEATQQYALAYDSDALVNLIERRRAALLRAGRGATLARWIALLGAAERPHHPHLLILQAELHRVGGRTAEAEAAIAEVCVHLLSSAAQ
jgi:LuxR family maltose regulon positive regulatory protein